MPAKRVLSVGQCGADHGSISASLRRSFDVDVASADDAAEALRRLEAEKFDLVLVNRVFDLDGSPGVDFIRQVKQANSPVPVMLVSNYPDAQQEAVKAGALPGFGKAALGEPATLSALRRALGA
jgi:two-component system chemotaxis response regulator CheY